jgi:predicted permease
MAPSPWIAFRPGRRHRKVRFAGRRGEAVGTSLEIANVLIPVLLCISAGFALARMHEPFDAGMVSSLVANIGYPALILSHLEGQHVPLDTFLVMMGAAVAVIACFAVGALAFLAATGLPRRAFLAPMMLNNVGNIGLPVCALAFGDQGLAYALAFTVVVMVGIFTIGIWVPMGKVTLGSLAKKPVIYAVVVAIGLMATNTRLPVMLDRTFSILGGLAIPLMLLTLGHTLATLKAGNLTRGIYLTVFHVAMAAVVAFALVHLFGFEGPARGVFIVLCMMPVSVATYLWVETYVPDRAADVAGFILLSTLLAVVVLPVVLVFWV